ncbi:MAG TPA: proline--tRNA ligase [Pirellulaceae bacterium]|nr:proline--tRNA ligase [Pirellulaceae bacterium]
MNTKTKTAISPTRAENYPLWYQEVIKASELAEISPVRGCMVIKPWGWGIWENMQRVLDRMFKETGHENAYFPLFIPMSFLEKEAQHVEGFAKECAVVTHHRLEQGPDGKLIPAGPLEEPLVVRPTSETIIGAMFAKWIQSYRDLPLKINQWANVVRWELRPRLFLRTAEFLWQEGHTVHATADEAWDETRLMLDIYAKFVEDYLAIPVIKGEKSAGERFPGADATLTIEAMMQDRKALQAGTSHFLGQNFSKAQEIKFQDQTGHEAFAWTTSWGVSTRLVGALVMAHSDDDGLVLPPRVAPKHVVILPIYRNDAERSEVLDYCSRLQRMLATAQFSGIPIQVAIDDRDLRGGEKKWYQVKRGVPIRVEVGPRDVAGGSVVATRRDHGQANSLPVEEFVTVLPGWLDEMQQQLFNRALEFRRQHSREFQDLQEFKDFFTPQQSDSEEPEIHGGFAMAHFADAPEVTELLKTMKVTVRCIPLDQVRQPGRCLFTGRETETRGVFAKAY